MPGLAVNRRGESSISSASWISSYGRVSRRRCRRPRRFSLSFTRSAMRAICYRMVKDHGGRDELFESDGESDQSHGARLEERSGETHLDLSRARDVFCPLGRQEDQDLLGL